MIDDFFKKIKVPDFIKPDFDLNDWYLVISKLKELIKENVRTRVINSKFDQVTMLGNNIYIGKNCTIQNYVVIEGPVWIGDNVQICTGAYIRPGTVIGNECQVGHAAEIKNSIMMDGSKVANHCFLGDSIMGCDARMGGHCETANRRFDQKEISFVYKNKNLATGLDKLGMVLGEGSRLGGGCFTSPGAMIGYNTFIATLSFVSGYIDPDKFVKTETSQKLLPNNFQGKLKNKSKFIETSNI